MYFMNPLLLINRRSEQHIAPLHHSLAGQSIG